LERSLEPSKKLIVRPTAEERIRERKLAPRHLKSIPAEKMEVPLEKQKIERQ